MFHEEKLGVGLETKSRLSPLPTQSAYTRHYSKLQLKEGMKHYMACRDTLSWGGSSGCSAIIFLCRASKSQLSFIGIDFSHRQVYSYNSTAAVVSLGVHVGSSAPMQCHAVHPAPLQAYYLHVYDHFWSWLSITTLSTELTLSWVVPKYLCHTHWAGVLANSAHSAYKRR